MGKEPPAFLEIVRRPFRRGLRVALQSTSLRSIKAVAYRVPFSRFSKIARWLLWGKEIIEWRGVKVEINPGHLLEYYAYFFGSYENEEIDKLVDLCRDAQVFVDVGANSGLFSLAIAHACPSLSVLAFEPAQDIAATFRANLRRNKHLCERIRLVDKALGDVNGTALFVPSNRLENPGLGRLGTGSHHPGGYEVPIVRLDSFLQIDLKPYVVKIDVEGAELQVLRGMAGLFPLGFPKAILVETHALYYGDAATEFNSQVVSELERGGFTISRLQSGTWVPLEKPLGAVGRTHLLAIKTEPRWNQTSPD